MEAGAAGARLPFDLMRIDGRAGLQPGFFAGDWNWGRAEVGWDVARHGHLSSLWVNFRRPDGLRFVRYLVLLKGVPFDLQRQVVRSVMDRHPGNVGCGDATGLGMDSNETLAGLYGDRWQSVTFTSSAKRDLGSLLRTCFDDGDQALPPAAGETKFIATDIYGIQRDDTGGRLKLVETGNPLDPDSHNDIAYSCALARMAAGITAGAAHLWVA